MEKLLSVDNLSTGYGKDLILKKVSFDILENEFIGVIGPNGSGKTTLARAITKVLPIKEGRILYEEKDLISFSLEKIAKNISYVPQEINPVFDMKIMDIAMMGRHPYIGRFHEETHKDIEIVLDSLKMTDTYELKDRYFDEVSSGEKQRVLIAKALAQEPKLLILDEPTSKLDIGHQSHIMSLLKKLNMEKNITIMAILHDLNIASDYCGRLIMLDKGAIKGIGAPREIIEQRLIEEVYKTFVLVNPSPASNKPHVTLKPGS